MIGPYAIVDSAEYTAWSITDGRTGKRRIHWGSRASAESLVETLNACVHGTEQHAVNRGYIASWLRSVGFVTDEWKHPLYPADVMTENKWWGWEVRP